MSALLEAASLSKTSSVNITRCLLSAMSALVLPRRMSGAGWGKRLRQKHPARLLMGLTPADSGTVSFNGQPLDFADAALRKNYYSQVQLVFQNAAAAFHPRKSIGSSIMLPMLNYGCTKAAAQERSIALLLAAGLTPQHAEKISAPAERRRMSACRYRQSDQYQTAAADLR